jgi:diguanylate cyclase (GGDEF)-like protein
MALAGPAGLPVSALALRVSAVQFCGMTPLPKSIDIPPPAVYANGKDAVATGGFPSLPAIVRKIRIFIVPALILAAAYYFLPEIPLLPPARQELAVAAPYLTAALGMFLAVHFHRGRPFFMLLVTCLFYWWSRSLDGAAPWNPDGQGLFQAFALLLPVNITILCFMRERGILSAPGRLRIVFLLLQTGAAWALFHNHYDAVMPYVTRRFHPLTLPGGVAVPQPALLVTLLAFILLAIRGARRQSPIDSGFLGVLVALFLALNRLPDAHATIAFATAGALILTLSILQESYNMAFRDDLTGLPARRALNESLHGLGRRYTVAMLDVDHFKKFNDTYGHDVGDQVLKMVGKKIMGVGGGGKPYRYGGEEFTVIFPRRSAADAIPHLEELRKTIADYQLFIRTADRPKDTKQGKEQRGTGGGEYVSVTISIGVAESGDGQSTPALVLKSADEALYRAKKQGRNRVCK